MGKRIVFRPIGYVYNNVAGERYSDWGDVVSEIVLDDALAPALEGIEAWSHLEVLFYISGVTARQRAIRRLHPQDRADTPLTGVLATRSQYRPNPIGATVVPLLERKGNVLTVVGLDAYNGTPVLDIKSWRPVPLSDKDVRVPEWVRLAAPKQEGESSALEQGEL